MVQPLACDFTDIHKMHMFQMYPWKMKMLTPPQAFFDFKLMANYTFYGGLRF